MSSNIPEVASLDEGDVDPDLMVGEEVEPEHDLDISLFEDEED